MTEPYRQDVLLEALLQARDRLEGIFEAVHPEPWTADDMHRIVQDAWFGMQEIDAALAAPREAAPAPAIEGKRAGIDYPLSDLRIEGVTDAEWEAFEKAIEERHAPAIDRERLVDAICAAEKATGWDLNVGEGPLADAIADAYEADGG